MTQKLLDDNQARGDVYDSDEQSLYKPGQKTNDEAANNEINDLNENFYGPSATEEDMQENQPDGQKAFSPDQLQDQEEGAEDGESSAVDGAESNFSYSGDDDQPSVNKSPKSATRMMVRAWMANRYAFMGGGSGIVIGIVMSFFSIMGGPGSIIQMAQSLYKFHFINDQVLMASRAGNLIRYRTTIGNPDIRNLGYFGNLAANHYDDLAVSKGMTMELEDRRSERVIIDTSNPESDKAIKNFKDRGFEIPEPVDGKISIELGNTSARTRRQAVGAITDNLEISKISSLIGARLLRVRAGADMHPFKNIVRAADEDLLTYIDKVKKQREERLANGVDKTAGRATAAQQDADGDGVPELDPLAEEVAKESNDITDIARSGGSVEARSAGVISGKLAKGTGVAGLISLTCSIYELGDLIFDIRDANINGPLIRGGVEAIAAGSQVKDSFQATPASTSMEEIGVYQDLLYDEETGTSWQNHQSVQSEFGEPLTGPDVSEGQKPGHTRPAFFDTMDKVFDSIPGGDFACKVTTSAVGGFILDGAGWAMNATGPLGFALNAGTDIAIGVASQVFVEDLIRWLSGEQTDLGASGAAFGFMVNVGARLASVDLSIAHGGTVLGSQQALEMDQEGRAQLAYEQQQKSTFARYFDINDSSSFVARLGRSPQITSPRTALASLSPGALTSDIFSKFGSSLAPTAYAQTESYDYGFPEYGYTVEEIDDERFENPYENAAYVEPRLELFNAKYGEPCFGITINPTTYKIQPGNSTKRFEDIGEGCGDRTDLDLTRYRFYLADMQAAKSLACYEGLYEEACAEFGFGVDTSQAPENGSDTLPAGDATSLAKQIIDSGNVTSNASSQLANIAAGTGPCPTINNGSYTVDTELLRVIAALAQGNKFTISSLHRGCNGQNVSGTTSLHLRGKAVDISLRNLNGISQTNYSDYKPEVKDFINTAKSLLPADCEVGVPNTQYESAAESVLSNCKSVFLDTPSTTGATGVHIHIGVR